MSSEPWPEGVGLVVLGSVDSTNAEALRRAPHLTQPTWILAHHQTAAKGRRGRPWAMPPGNFGATLVTRGEGTPHGVSRAAFVAGLALHDALGALTGRPDRLALKWPNDLLLDGGKLAGILLERERLPGPGDIHALAVGFGVNLAVAPGLGAVEPGALRPVALAPLASVAPEALLDALAPAHAWRADQAAEGFEPVRADWLARAAGLGGTITARTPRETRTGVFETIDDLGCLILRTPEGCHRIASADVFLEAS